MTGCAITVYWLNIALQPGWHVLGQAAEESLFKKCCCSCTMAACWHLLARPAPRAETPLPSLLSFIGCSKRSCVDQKWHAKVASCFTPCSTSDGALSLQLLLQGLIGSYVQVCAAQVPSRLCRPGRSGTRCRTALT